MTAPTDAIGTRFNAGVHARREYSQWKLRTEKFVGTAWQTMATFPTLSNEVQASQQRERLQRHAEAFGGLIRLMRGERLLAAWRDGELVCDLRSEDTEAA